MPDREEALVYFVVSPEYGPGHSTFEEESILARGGIQAIEQDLKAGNYWYGYLGKVWGDRGPRSLTFQESEFALLPKPDEIAWKVGRCNPAFSGSELERLTFHAAYSAISRMLESWKQVENGTVDAHSIKELKISRPQLRRVAGAFTTLPVVYEVVEVSVIKFWYDSSWPQPQFPDLVLAEFPLTICLQFRRSIDDTVVADVLPPGSC
jgi:hypothetical protein